MKKLSALILHLLLLAGLFACQNSAVAASTEFWDATSPSFGSPGSGGTGSWNTNAANTVWWVTGASDSAWTNGNIAEFAGTAGTVTVNTPVTNSGIIFTTTGYTIGGTSNLIMSTATITLPDNGSETINCPVAGPTTVTVSPTTSGPSTLNLGGINTYTGATTINSGATLTITGAGDLNQGVYAGAMTITGGFTYDSSAVQTNSGTITGTGLISVEGSGTLALTHANTGYTGTTTINPGSTLQLNAISAVGTATTITNNGTLNLYTTGTAQYSMAFVGSGVINFPVAYSASSSENDRFEGSVGGLSTFTGTVNVYTYTSTGATNGTGTIGVGQILLTAGDNLNAPGVWNIGPGSTVGYPNGTTCSATVILDGPGDSQPYGALRLDGGDTQSGNILLNGANITIGDNTAAPGPSVISGNISDGGNNYGWAKAPGSISSGNTTIILSGINTYTGPTIFSSPGAIQVGSAETPGVSGPLGKSPANNPGNIVFIGAVGSATSGATLQYSTVNSNDYSGRFSTAASQAYSIDVNGQPVKFATPLTSSGGSLTLKDTAGGGNLTLGATNTYNGITTVNSGNLDISGSIAGTIINVNGGSLQLDRPTALPSGTILTLPSSPASSMVNLNFTGTQNITTLNLGSGNPQSPGTYGSATNLSVLYPESWITGTGVINVEPPTYWDANGTDASSQSDADGGGSGNWDYTLTNWWQTGSSDLRWVSNNVATFAGTAGTVTLDTNVVADGLVFDTSGYVITNTGTSVLTLAGTPIITIPGGNTAEIDCSIAGTGGLAESGPSMLTLGGSNSFVGAISVDVSGTLILNGPNACTNGTSIASSGALTIGGDGNLGDGIYPGGIAMTAGTLTYNSSASQTLSGIISGSATVTQDGPGPLTLGGLSTFTGSIVINSGTLAVSGFADLGNNPTFNVGGFSGGINDNGALIWNSSAAQTLSGPIYGSGSLTQEGAATLTLSGNDSYAGTTTIGTNSDLTISGSGALGGSDYETNLINNGIFDYDSTVYQTLGGVISGSGVLVLAGTSSVTLTDTNTYTGGTTIGSGCTLTIGDPGDLGNGAYAANITNTGAFIYNSSANQTLSGVISGTAGTLTQEGPGTLTLNGANSYTGETTIDSGSELVISGSGDLGKGSYAGPISNQGALIYNSSANQTLSGQIFDSGAGATLTQNGPGNLNLSASEAYSGTTTIGPGCDLIITGSGSLGGGDYETNIIDNGTFTYDSAVFQTLGGVISGSGAFIQAASSTVTLTGPNTYAGATIITNGTVALTGSGSINNSTNIAIFAGATFDVSGLASATYNLSGSTSLSASGSAAAAAAINGASGGTVNLGSQPVSLAFKPQTFNGDATHPALNISQGALTLAGNVITVNNAGASPLGTGVYSLIQVAGGTINGAPNAAVAAVTGAGLAPNSTASLSVSAGSVNLVVTTASVPVINNVTLSNGKLIFSGTNGTDGGTYHVLTSTNLVLPLPSWTDIATNTFSPTGTFSVTNAIGAGSRFFILK